jgi:YaiO family outer membrane protein
MVSTIFFISDVIAQQSLETQSSSYSARRSDIPAIFNSSAYIEAGLTFDRLSNQYDSWDSQYVHLFIPYQERGFLNLQIQNLHRFNKTDQSYAMNYAYPFTYGVFQVEAGFSPTANFTAQTAYGMGWNGFLPNGFGYILNAHQKQFNESYADASLNIYNLGIEKYFGYFRAAYVRTLSSINHQQSEFAQRIQLQWFGQERNRLGITYSRGSEPAIIGLNELSSTPVQLIQIDGLYWVSQRTGITAAIWHAEEGSYYIRNGIQLGVRLNF